MNSILLRVSALVLILLSASASATPFQNLTFDAALTQAAAEKKIVLVDFFTTWCGPCKQLDETTWKDGSVITLLHDKTVALRLDAEKNKALADRFSVEAYPTILLLRPDGTEIDRLVGYEDAATFTANFADSLAGRTSLDRAKAAVAAAAANKDPSAEVEARYRLGQAYAQAGQKPQALDEFLWCYDDGMKQVPAYAGVRVSFLLSDLGNLARHYEPAQAAMTARRDQAFKELTAQPHDAAAAADYSNLNHALNDDQATLAYFQRLPAGSPMRERLGFNLFDLLVANQKYADAISAVPYGSFKRVFIVIKEQSLRMSPSEAAGIKSYEVTQAAKEVEALAGAGKLDDARDLIHAVTEYDPSDAARSTLHGHLVRAGHAELL